MKKIIALLFAVLTAATPAAVADGVVYVDFERIFRDSKKIEDARKSINGEFASQQKGLDDANAKIRGMLDALEKEAPTLSDDDRENRRKEITALERDFLRDRRALVEDRGVRLQELRRVINNEIGRIIREVSEARGYKMVLNPFLVLPLSNERTLTHNIIIHAVDEADITAEIISRFDAEANLDG